MKRLIATSVVALALVGAAVASANVLIFSTDFGKRKDIARIDRLVGGKKCQKSWKGKKALGTRVKTGHKSCVFQTGIEGDGKRPNHTIVTTARVLKKTSKKVRPKAYIGAAVRANSKSSYEFRVFPKGRRFELIRNGGTIAKDRSKAIGALGKRNKIQLSATGAKVIAKVNGATAATFHDDEPSEVRGTKTAIAFGSEARSKKSGYMVFKNLKILIPDP